jgi:tetratricopeptide (TPR) repeat protein
MRGSLAHFAAILVVSLSAAALAQDRGTCLDTKDHLQAIRGCSEIIRKDPKDAIAYYMRGTALAKNGDVGQAISDFSKSIALNPRFAPAYSGRAAAYISKGDAARAAVDTAKAGELAARSEKEIKAKAAAKDKPAKDKLAKDKAPMVGKAPETAKGGAAPEKSGPAPAKDAASVPKAPKIENKPFNPFREPPG